MTLVLLAGLCVPGELLRSDAATLSAPRRIEVTARRYSFDPDVITLKKDEAVILVVKSADVAHGLRCRELNIDINVPKGGTVEVKVTPHSTGEFVGHCSVFCGNGHGSMMVTFHVIG
jgi:cytochrome c oxidase subunit 2